MHQLILITAMSATTGLFGGGKHCGGKVHHARAASVCSSAPHGMPFGPAGVSYPGSPQMAPAMPPAPVAPPATPAIQPAPVAPPAPTSPPAPNSASYAPAGRTFIYQATYGPTSAR
jgi:hypothetical protein